MKNKSQRMTKEEKMELQKQYRAASEKNNSVAVHLIRSRVEAILGIIVGFGLMIYAIISNSTVWFEYLAYAFVIIFCLFLFYKANDLYTKELNKFAIDNKSKKKF